MSAGGMMSGVDGDLLTRVRTFAASYPELVVSSAFLAAQVGVSAKAISMVLAPFGVRPRRLSGDVRGYTTAELAEVGLEAPAVVTGGDEASALVVLSAGAGHDMTGALRAAGWLP